MNIKDYFGLIKFSHTIFALPFAAIGFALAVMYDGYPFQWNLLLYVLLCMIFCRSAAMGFNRYADYKFDALNDRTAKREVFNADLYRRIIWCIWFNRAKCRFGCGRNRNAGCLKGWSVYNKRLQSIYYEC